MISVIAYGLVSTIVTESLKVFPALRRSDLSKRLLAFIVAFVIGLIPVVLQTSTSKLDYVIFPLEVLFVSYLLYKTILESIVDILPMVLKSQIR